MVWKVKDRFGGLPVGRRYCSICGKKSLYFLPFGHEADVFQKLNIIGGGRRKNCTCPHCRSRDRFRWTWYVIENYTKISNSCCRVLHIAPEPQIARKMKSLNPQCEYITGDIAEGRADHIIDVTKIPFKDNSFDYVIMNHVIEHIPDEEAAVNEIKRVLKPEGNFIFSMPIAKNRKTYEDKNIISPQARKEAYGQDDHCRLYGEMDAIVHFESYGLSIESYIPQERVDYKKIVKEGLLPDDTIIIASIR